MEQLNNQLPQKQENAPNSVATLILGILSLVTGCLFAGLIFGIIGVVLGKKGKNAVASNPGAYKGTGMLSAGYIMSIIGLILGAVSVLLFIIMLIAGVSYLDWIYALMN